MKNKNAISNDADAGIRPDTAEKAQQRLAARLLSKRELAALLNVSERTLDNWVAEKKIPRLQLSPRLTRFIWPRVEAALARYEIKEVGARR